MYNLIMDTSTDYLLVAIVNDDAIGEIYLEKHHKKTSEFIVVKLSSMMKKMQLSIDDIESVIVTKGPGSFTGIRLALTVAKMIGFAKKKNVYAISSLQAYCNPMIPTLVTLDARANRVYVGHYENSKAVEEDCILTMDAYNDYKYLHPQLFISTIESIVAAPMQWVKNMLYLKQPTYLVKDIHALSPVYLKTL
jgi:tRNA threonylcarbamoyladenosine biosynthesis protein TsaB